MGNDGTAGNVMGSIVADLASIAADGAAAQALTTRATIVSLSDASHDAVLRPREPGGVSLALRAALAVRMARRNADDRMAAHYGDLLDTANATDEIRIVANPEFMPDGDPLLRAIVRHVDILTQSPREATKDDIVRLTAAGVAEADIVRLAELAAFVNFQARFVVGLRLLEQAQ